MNPVSGVRSLQPTVAKRLQKPFSTNPLSATMGSLGVAEPDAGSAIAPVLRNAVNRGILSDENPIVVFYDLAAFDAECRALVSAFPASSLHGFAIKACPLVKMIHVAHAAGLGGEAASIGEVALAKAAGIPAGEIIFDSPAKSDAHLRSALRDGVHLNADNIEEVERIDRMITAGLAAPGTTAGLRVNPQTGSGTIAMTSTAGKANKFGVPLRESREELLAVFEMYTFLSCVHVHVGSQGCKIEQLVAGVKAAVELAEEVNTRAPGRVTSIDIGGGLSVNYEGDEPVTDFGKYAAALREEVPGLFSFRIITEFGRRLVAGAGWIAARVQTVKRAGGTNYVVCHAGADVLMRPAYAPDKWSHRFEVRGPRGARKEGEATGKFDVAGPLCFSGDIVGRDREFVSPCVNDIIVVRDAGAYTVGMYSRHTSQLVPAVYGYNPERPGEFKVLKKKETLEELVRFWGGDVSREG